MTAPFKVLLAALTLGTEGLAFLDLAHVWDHVIRPGIISPSEISSMLGVFIVIGGTIGIAIVMGVLMVRLHCCWEERGVTWCVTRTER